MNWNLFWEIYVFAFALACWSCFYLLVVRIRKNSFANIQKSPLFQLYPVGSEADIFYNPEKPKEAFVQRYEGVSRWLGILLAGVAVLLTIIGLPIVFGPEIVMSSGTF